MVSNDAGARGGAPPSDEDEPEIEYEMAYYSPSGFSQSFSFLAMRYDTASGFKSAYGETFVGEIEPHPTSVFAVHTHYMLPGWLTGLWRSTEGRLWVSESYGRVFAFASPKCDNLVIHELEGSLFGIYGLSDHHVITWGEKDTTPIMYRWDGNTWSHHPSPAFRVLSVHGPGPDDLWASGYEGGLARWDGGQWRPIQTRLDEQLVSVFVAGPDEIYACGNRGTVFEGSASGLARIDRIPNAQIGDVTCVAKWKGELWVAANRLGLWRRVGKTAAFECVKDKVDAVGMDVRADMVIACRRVLVHTADGQTWKGGGRDHVLKTRGNTPLGGPYP